MFSNYHMIITMVALNFFVTRKSHQQRSEGRGDVRVSARQLSLDLVWIFSCSDCTALLLGAIVLIGMKYEL